MFLYCNYFTKCSTITKLPPPCHTGRRKGYPISHYYYVSKVIIFSFFTKKEPPE